MTEAVQHESYKGDGAYDVSLLKLAHAFEPGPGVSENLRYSRKLAKYPVGWPLIASRWGATSKEGDLSPTELRWGSTEAVSKPDCNAIYEKNKIILDESLFCAKSPAGKRSCEGDNGELLYDKFDRQ